MANNVPSIVRLGCVGCGATLEVSQQMERLACAHCGTEQMVERSGGAVHLQSVKEAISKVQVGTDKTAAELAITRLSNERESLVNVRFLREQYWNNECATKRFELSAALNGGKRGFTATFLFCALLCAAPFLIIALIVWPVSLEEIRGGATVNFRGIIVFIVGSLAGGLVLAFLTQRHSERYYRELGASIERELADLESRRLDDLAPLDSQLSSINIKLQKQRKITDS
jgi:predicted RNA-binding Zn-ribbon protein involved in translation (DUF1610 family)